MGRVTFLKAGTCEVTASCGDVLDKCAVAMKSKSASPKKKPAVLASPTPDVTTKPYAVSRKAGSVKLKWRKVSRASYYDSALTFVRFGKFSALLCADALGDGIAGAKATNAIKGAVKSMPGKSVDFLQVSHHGMVVMVGKGGA